VHLGVVMYIIDIVHLLSLLWKTSRDDFGEGSMAELTSRRLFQEIVPKALHTLKLCLWKNSSHASI